MRVSMAMMESANSDLAEEVKILKTNQKRQERMNEFSPNYCDELLGIENDP